MTSDPVSHMRQELIGLGQIGGDRDVLPAHPIPSPPIGHAPDLEVEPMTATQERRAGPRDRPLDIIREGDGDPRHGRLSTYNNHSCRCPDCTRAMREYSRDLRERRRTARADGHG